MKKQVSIVTIIDNPADTIEFIGSVKNFLKEKWKINDEKVNFHTKSIEENVR